MRHHGSTRQGTAATVRGETSIVPSLEALAPAIVREHEAAVTAVRSGLEHARRAGDLLLDAKRQVPHGEWLPWLAAHCPEVSGRTAQAYMRIAKRWPELEANAKRVADLSLREALAKLASDSGRVARFDADGQGRIIARAESGTRLQAAIAETVREQHRAAIRNVAPDVRPVHATDRVVRVVRRDEDGDGRDEWTIRVGPNDAGVQLRARVDALKAKEPYADRLFEVEWMRDEARRLRAEADAWDRLACDTREAIEEDMRSELEDRHGPAYLYVETTTFFGVSDDLSARLADMDVDEQILALFAEAGDRTGRGWWGDIRLSTFSANGPCRPRASLLPRVEEVSTGHSDP